MSGVERAQGSDIRNQICSILRAEKVFETLGHQRETRASELLKFAAQKRLLTGSRAQGDAIGRFRRDHAGEFAVILRGRCIIDIPRLDGAIGIENRDEQGFR